MIVWFHGGGFAAGTGSTYDGSNLARKRDVVVVTVNHRLNAFGYLYLGDLGGERFSDLGNAGILTWSRRSAGSKRISAALAATPGMSRSSANPAAVRRSVC